MYAISNASSTATPYNNAVPQRLTATPYRNTVTQRRTAVPKKAEKTIRLRRAKQRWRVMLTRAPLAVPQRRTAKPSCNGVTQCRTANLYCIAMPRKGLKKSSPAARQAKKIII